MIRLDDTLEVLRKLDAEASLLEFTRQAWPILEPGRKLIEGKVLEAICDHLEAVTRGEIRRLLINVPPGCMKSLLVDVFWPAWLWGPRGMPWARFLSWAYAEQLTLRDNRKCRNVISSPWYVDRWGDRFELTGDQNEKRLFENNHAGFKAAAGVHGATMGHRGDFLVVDDPHQTKEAESELKRTAALEWFAEALPTRINDPDKSAIVVIMQRVHSKDVSGHVLEHDLGYDHLCLPMEYEPDHPFPSKTALGFRDWRTNPGELLWPERFSRRHLEEDLKPTFRSWGGEYAVAGQLQQRPAPRGGGFFKDEWWNFVDFEPDLVLQCRGWDLAGTDSKRSPRTAGVRMGFDSKGGIYICHALADQWTPGVVEDKVKATTKHDGPRVTQSLPQDPGQAGKAQKVAFARLLQGAMVHFSPESGSKEQRAAPLAAQAELGNVHIVRGGWNEAFLAEARDFPRGHWKDQIDAASRAYAWLVSKWKRKAAPVAPQVY